MRIKPYHERSGLVNALVVDEDGKIQLNRGTDCPKQDGGESAVSSTTCKRDVSVSTNKDDVPRKKTIDEGTGYILYIYTILVLQDTGSHRKHYPKLFIFFIK